MLSQNIRDQSPSDAAPYTRRIETSCQLASTIKGKVVLVYTIKAHRGNR
jgi:hypothetical protein